MLGWDRGGRGRLLLLGRFMVPPLPTRGGCSRPGSLGGLLAGPGADPPMAPGLPVTALDRLVLPVDRHDSYSMSSLY